MRNSIRILLIVALSSVFSCKKDCLKKGECELSTYFSDYVEVQVTPAVVSTAYYIDAENGHKKNDGKTEENAFVSIGQLNEITFVPGDQILFKRGQIHYGKFELKQGGIESNRIYISAYGTGDLPVVKSEDGSNLKSDIQTLFLNQASYVTIQNLNIHGGIQAILLSNASHVVIAGCRVGEQSESGIRATGDYSEGSGSNFGEIHHCLIYSGAAGNLGDRQSTDGVQLLDGASNWHIHHNEFKAWSHSGMLIKQIYNLKENNYNIVERNLFNCGDIDYMRALDISGGDKLTQYNVFRYNIVRNQTVTSHLHGNNNVMAYNLFLGLKASSATEQPWAIDLHVITNQVGGVERTKLVCYANTIHNNLFYNWQGGRGVRILSKKNGADNEIDNCWILSNIFYNVEKPIEIDDGPTTIGVSFNLFYAPSATPEILWNGINYNIEAFENENGLAGFVLQDNIEGDPLFLNAGAENFNLNASSPAINTGLGLLYLNDFDGNPVDGDPDIGPFEFQ